MRDIPMSDDARADVAGTDAPAHEAKPVSLTPYFVLGFCLLVLALVVRAPASLLQKALPANLPVAVSAWGGSIWDGQAAFVVAGDTGFLRWKLQPKRLLGGRLVADIQAQGALQLTGTVELGRQAWAIKNLQGELPSTLLQAMLPAGWSLPGSVQAEALSVARNGHDKGAWTTGDGQLLWAGGPMQYNMNGQAQSASLPPLTVTVRLDGEVLVLTLAESAGNLGLALVRLSPDGQMETRLRERLLRYSPGYHSSGGDPGAVVVTAKQAL